MATACRSFLAVALPVARHNQASLGRLNYIYLAWASEPRLHSRRDAMAAVERKPVQDYVAPDFHQVNLDIETFLKTNKRLKLDADAQICRDHLSPEGCPLGIACPKRHTQPSPLNFVPPPPQPNNPRDKEKVNTVCKHYLRGLCIMGDQCEFLHEYNRRSFPECWWHGTWGFCSMGDECLYDHRKVRRRECPDYNRGFCRLGELRCTQICLQRR